MATQQFPLSVLHGEKYVPPQLTTNKPATSIFKMLPAHGEEYEEQTLLAGASYINSNIIYVVVFIIMVLGLFYLVGKKATVYFLLLVLLGQLIIPGGTGEGVLSFLKSFKKG